MKIRLREATVEDAVELAASHTAVAEHLTGVHGHGPWSTRTTERGVRYAMRQMAVFVARDRRGIIATLRLATKKPWAIDKSYFAPSRQPLYLLAMAVEPGRQRQGIGRRCLEQAKRIAKACPADAIRLDTYDAAAGAGPFYAKCGCKEVGRITYRHAPLIYFEILLA